MQEPASFHDQDSESRDDLLIGGLQYIQARAGYRFSIDSILLAHFPIIDHSTDRVVDLGAGNGLLALLLSQRSPALHLLAVEVQPAMAERARRNIALNGLEERIEVLQADIKNIRSCLTAGSYNLAVCNPPFFKAGSGKTSRNEEERQARHEILGSLGDFVKAGAWLLQPGGRLDMVVPPGRLQELASLMSGHGLALARLRPVHSRSNENAALLLVEAKKGGGSPARILPPLVIYEDGASYTEEIMDMYGGKA